MLLVPPSRELFSFFPHLSFWFRWTVRRFIHSKQSPSAHSRTAELARRVADRFPFHPQSARFFGCESAVSGSACWLQTLPHCRNRSGIIPSHPSITLHLALSPSSLFSVCSVPVSSQSQHGSLVHSLYTGCTIDRRTAAVRSAAVTRLHTYLSLATCVHSSPLPHSHAPDTQSQLTDSLVAVASTSTACNIDQQPTCDFAPPFLLIHPPNTPLTSSQPLLTLAAIVPAYVFCRSATSASTAPLLLSPPFSRHSSSLSQSCGGVM